jgi:hypothetical protein
MTAEQLARVQRAIIAAKLQPWEEAQFERMLAGQLAGQVPSDAAVFAAVRTVFDRLGVSVPGFGRDDDRRRSNRAAASKVTSSLSRLFDSRRRSGFG